MSKKIFKFMLVALIIISVATSGFPVLAADSPSKKEEVIYASLDGRGAVQKAYAVNIFANEKSIRDYGNYSSIKNMNSDDKIVDGNGAISFTTSTNPVFYQGYLKNTELPWNINIKYILDGREVRPKNLGGKSGHLEIKIDISKNSKCKGDFFKGYALQTTVKLDSNICNNIKAEGATFANVGGIKQLTYTIMPNKGKSILIQSDVKDFTMDGISINGIKLNLGIDKKSLNLSSFTNKINLLTKSISLLDNGASAVNTGSLNLNSGANNLSKGINKISTALVTLNGKSKSLTGGSAAVSKALSDIKSAL
ncbi:MAG: hypothetical protein LBM02_04000, partial [Lachnospiraceae bacterium]|nr:hypothetical protein [Lachnospiraceae bacterium]